MVTQQQSRITPELLTAHPTHLLVGNGTELEQITNTTLQKIFCPLNGCGTCTVCMQIVQKQHHAVSWFLPEKGYTTVQLEPLFHTINFALGESHDHFFILQKAESLNSSCANSLLKVLEEPPKGYHFILHTDRSSQILPTITSRSIITHIQNTNANQKNHPLYLLFTRLQKNDLVQFVTTLQENPLTEQESSALLDTILNHWITVYKNECATHVTDRTTTAIITQLQQALKQQPMPGSSKIFWRNLYMNCLQAQ